MLKVRNLYPINCSRHRLLRCHPTEKPVSSTENNKDVDRWSKLVDRVDAFLIEDSTSSKANPRDTTSQSVSRGVIDPSKLRDGELPHIAVVGRPNVGKSALVNRLTGSSTAIVFDKPGVTRDRLFVRAFWRRSEFMLMDTGGLPNTKIVSSHREPSSMDVEIPVGVELQVAAAVEESDCVVFVTDGQVGPVDGDTEILNWLRKQHSDKPILLAVNKCEDAFSADYQASLFWELGCQPHPVSAISGLGTGDLLDALVSMMPPMHRKKEEPEHTSVAIIGRPNTGKSSLLNALVGQDRAIVSPIPGTTRDAIDCRARLWNGEIVKLVDTAGIRRQTVVHGSSEEVESMMVNRSIRALRQCNVAVLMIDCFEGIRQQDAKIVDQIKQEGCSLVVVGNKFDLLDPTDWDKPTVAAILKQQLREAEWAKVVVTSVKDEDPLKSISKAILAADASHKRRWTTSTVNGIIQDAVHFRPPPASKTGKKGRVYYASQVSTRPPTFVLFVNSEEIFEEAYRKYVERYLRENLDLEGTAVRIVIRGKKM